MISQQEPMRITSASLRSGSPHPASVAAQGAESGAQTATAAEIKRRATQNIHNHRTAKEKNAIKSAHPTHPGWQLKISGWKSRIRRTLHLKSGRRSGKARNRKGLPESPKQSGETLR
jgi:hypothetical protein